MPPRFKTVESTLLQDVGSNEFLTFAEQLLDEFIHRISSGADKQAKWKRTEKGFTIFLKIKRNIILFSGYDSQKSRSSTPKKFYIQWERQMKSTREHGKCKQGLILINDRGRIIKRSVKRSPYFSGIFNRMKQLDQALIGPEHVVVESKVDATLKEHIQVIEHLITNPAIKGVIESRSNRLVNLLNTMLPELDLLDIEERHTVKRMLSTELPGLLEGYISLSDSNKERRHGDLFQALCKMELTLHQLLEKLEDLRLSKVDHLLKVNKMRYDKK
ncbi:hypothetical protein [Guptibacillus algicola]|uniref:hypothetical protein n=1 Tax=Guptibacillus algicola TaxID=225844 RepID=UPI001CD23937|nr:hypothetical protein [Alkalihalobacillus algicola]MCA0988217.1 hypothetical protein [Alkalihalobacillus algicola]